jgi:hypothetical protein
MVVAYLLSQGRQQEADDLPAALVAAQMKLPGLRCIVGESIPVASILAQHIENQVKVSDKHSTVMRLGCMRTCVHEGARLRLVAGFRTWRLMFRARLSRA